MKTERKLLIEKYHNGFNELKAALAAIPEAAIDFKPAPEKWSVREVVVHMADSEANSYVRLRKGIAESGSPITAYDQDKWAILFRYSECDMEDALNLIGMLRKMNSKLIGRMSEEEWSCFFMHPESGKKSMEDWLNIYTDHIDIHIKQMQRNVDAFQQGKK